MAFFYRPTIAAVLLCISRPVSAQETHHHLEAFHCQKPQYVDTEICVTARLAKQIGSTEIDRRFPGFAEIARSVVADAPNGFASFKGPLIASHGSESVYATTLRIPGTSRCLLHIRTRADGKIVHIIHCGEPMATRPANVLAKAISGYPFIRVFNNLTLPTAPRTTSAGVTNPSAQLGHDWDRPGSYSATLATNDFIMQAVGGPSIYGKGFSIYFQSPSGIGLPSPMSFAPPCYDSTCD